MTHWFTADEIARLYGVRPSYVKKLAHLHQWRRTRVGHRAAYLFEDVSAWNETRLPRVLAER